MSEMKIVEMPIEDVIPYDNNPRLNEDSIDAVAESISNYGFRVPIVVDKDSVIICGHTRRLAAKKLGLKTVPVVVAADLSPEKVKAFRLDDNKTAELSTWDFAKLQHELFDLKDEGYDLSTLAFGESELNRLLEDKEDDSDAKEEEIEEDGEDMGETSDEDKYDSVYGGIYQLGRHRLVCGDCTEGLDIAKLLEGDGDAPVELWLSDPPYNVAYAGFSNKEGDDVKDKFKRNTEMKISNDKMSDEEYDEFICKAFRNCLSYMKKGGSYYLFHGWNCSDVFRRNLLDNGAYISNMLIWVKSHLSFSHAVYFLKHEQIWFGWKSGGVHRWYGAHDDTTTTVQKWNIVQKCSIHPCLAPETLVMTQSGYREIAGIVAGDRVLSSDGRFHEVEDVTSHSYHEDIYKIRTAGNNICDMATHNHSYLVWSNADRTASFVEASDLKVGDFVMTPRLKDFHDIRNDKLLWSSRLVEWNGTEYYIRRIMSIEKRKYNGEVINLCVKDNHTFQTINGMTHNTMKPVDMLKYFITNSSQKDEIVLDTFGGSGSTLIACEQTGRICRMMEIMPRYADAIRKRWAEFVHGKDCDWRTLAPKVGEVAK